MEKKKKGVKGKGWSSSGKAVGWDCVGSQGRAVTQARVSGDELSPGPALFLLQERKFIRYL